MDPNQKLQELKEAIAITGVTIGAKPPSDENEIAAYNLTITQIQRHYPNITGPEIIQAFELNCTGKEWDTIESFGKLDFPLFGKVMKAYQEYKRRAVREFNIKMVNAVKELGMKTVKTLEQLQEDSYNFIVNHYREHGEWPYGDYHNAWIHFWYKFSLKRADVEPWFEKETQKIVEQLLALKRNETSELSVQAINLKLQPEAIKAECRRRFFQDYHEKNTQA